MSAYTTTLTYNLGNSGYSNDEVINILNKSAINVPNPSPDWTKYIWAGVAISGFYLLTQNNQTPEAR